MLDVIFYFLVYFSAVYALQRLDFAVQCALKTALAGVEAGQLKQLQHVRADNSAVQSQTTAARSTVQLPCCSAKGCDSLPAHFQSTKLKSLSQADRPDDLSLSVI